MTQNLKDGLKEFWEGDWKKTGKMVAEFAYKLAKFVVPGLRGLVKVIHGAYLIFRSKAEDWKDEVDMIGRMFVIIQSMDGVKQWLYSLHPELLGEAELGGFWSASGLKWEEVCSFDDLKARQNLGMMEEKAQMDNSQFQALAKAITFAKKRSRSKGIVFSPENWQNIMNADGFWKIEAGGYLAIPDVGVFKPTGISPWLVKHACGKRLFPGIVNKVTNAFQLFCKQRSLGLLLSMWDSEVRLTYEQIGKNYEAHNKYLQDVLKDKEQLREKLKKKAGGATVVPSDSKNPPAALTEKALKNKEKWDKLEQEINEGEQLIKEGQQALKDVMLHKQNPENFARAPPRSAAEGRKRTLARIYKAHSDATEQFTKIPNHEVVPPSFEERAEGEKDGDMDLAKEEEVNPRAQRIEYTAIDDLDFDTSGTCNDPNVAARPQNCKEVYGIMTRELQTQQIFIREKQKVQDEERDGGNEDEVECDADQLLPDMIMEDRGLVKEAERSQEYSGSPVKAFMMDALIAIIEDDEDEGSQTDRQQLLNYLDEFIEDDCKACYPGQCKIDRVPVPISQYMTKNAKKMLCDGCGNNCCEGGSCCGAFCPGPGCPQDCQEAGF